MKSWSYSQNMQGAAWELHTELTTSINVKENTISALQNVPKNVNLHLQKKNI